MRSIFGYLLVLVYLSTSQVSASPCQDLRASAISVWQFDEDTYVDDLTGNYALADKGNDRALITALNEHPKGSLDVVALSTKFEEELTKLALRHQQELLELLMRAESSYSAAGYCK